MAAAIRVVDEQDVSPPETIPMLGAGPGPSFGVGGVPTAQPVPAPDPRVDVLAANVQKIAQAAESRLQALEQAVQGVPRGVGVLRSLSRPLGSRALVSLALLGCLGLAGAQAYQPSWQGLAIFGAYSILVFLPIVAAAYFRGE